jgi:hypothetical protein
MSAPGVVKAYLGRALRETGHTLKQKGGIEVRYSPCDIVHAADW